MADPEVLIEFVRMYQDGAIGFTEIVSMVTDMCGNSVSDSKLSKILSEMEKGNVRVGFTALLNAL
jgi:Ca2+-binding EF-hand superfamily protein